jgi:plastocyanin
MLFAHGTTEPILNTNNLKKSILQILAALCISLLLTVILSKIAKQKIDRKNLNVVFIGLALVMYLGILEATNVPPATTNSSQASQHDHTVAQGAVTMTNSGYEPAEITIQAGESVQWTNDSEWPMWVASDPHPSHDGLKGFDQRQLLRRGKTYQFTFEQAGTYGYHDHLNPAKRGTIRVNP